MQILNLITQIIFLNKKLFFSSVTHEEVKNKRKKIKNLTSKNYCKYKKKASGKNTACLIYTT